LARLRLGKPLQKVSREFRLRFGPGRRQTDAPRIAEGKIRAQPGAFHKGINRLALAPGMFGD
jgi:hypothetical protein